MASQTAVLLEGDIEVVGRMPWSSNATFAVNVCFEGATTTAVYKPARGERPLWDFPSGLYRREVAAYELSQWLGWEIVPTTVLREEAPLGEGSLQWYVDADHSQHYFTLLEDEATHDQLRRICVFDILVNNTDRKGGHCLVDGDRHIWGIDNGLAFHAEFKLRTVIWDFAGEAIPDDVMGDVADLVERGLPESLRDLLDPFERDAILTRARALLELGALPTDTSGHAYPWPLVDVRDHNERLANQGDVDELVRQVDRLCDAADWDGLVDLRMRCRAALERGHQLWPVASLISYRLALEAPGPWAARALTDTTAGSAFTLGPLAEVAASSHTWDELEPHLEVGPARALCAHERVVRGEDLTGADVDVRILELPLSLAPWEPDYPVATYRPQKIEVPSPPAPRLEEVPSDGLTQPGAQRDDPDATRALLDLSAAWTSESNGRAQAVAVAGDAFGAIAALGPRRVRAARISAAVALATMAWVGASGGAHGRRKGMATGRFGAMWALATLAGMSEDWPVPADELGEAAEELVWYRWDAWEPETGWRFHLAVEDPPEGLAWAVAATDAR